MGGIVTKEQSISHAQYLNLVYSHLGTLYDLIPHAPRSSNDPSKPALGSHVDGIVVFIKSQSATQFYIGTNTKSPPSPTQTSEVYTVQFVSSRQSVGKNKNKGKSKKYSNKQESENTQVPNVGGK
jgi:hypothetical protein